MRIQLELVIVARAIVCLVQHGVICCIVEILGLSCAIERIPVEVSAVVVYALK